MNKPKFDSSQPFETAKPKFDSSKPFTSADTTKPDEEPGQLESLGRGALQGATFGLSDEAAGGVEALGQLAGVQGLSSPFKTGVSARTEGSTGFDLDALMKAYQKGRDEERLANTKAKEANPLTYMGGELAGGFAVPAGLIGNAAKEASFGAKLLSGAKTGATLGAIGGAGMSDADLTKGEVGDFSKDVAGSAVLGGGLGSAAEAVIPAAGSALDDVLSNVKAYKLAKRAGQAAAEGTPLFGDEAKQGLNKDLRQKGIDLIDALNDTQSDIGKQMNPIKAKPSKPVLVDSMIKDISDSNPINEITDPQDKIIAKRAQDNLDNMIQKVERKEPVFSPSPDVAKQSLQEKAMNRLNQAVANDNKKSYDTFARYLIAKENGNESQLVSLSKSLENMGIDTDLMANAEGKIPPQLSSMLQATNNPEDIVALSSKLQEAKLFPDPKIVQETDTQTGLSTIRAVRGNSTTSVAVPPDLNKYITKLKLNWEPTVTVNRPSVNASTIKDVSNTLYQLSKDPNITSNDVLRPWLKNAADKIKARLPESMSEEDMASLNKLNKQYTNIMEGKSQLGNIDSDTSQTGRNASSSKESSLATKLEDYYKGDNQNVVSINNAIDSLKETNPELANTLQKNIKNSSLDLATSRALTAEGLGHGVVGGTLGLATKTLPSLLSYGTGKAVRTLTTEAPNKIVGMGKALYDMAPEHLQGVVDGLVAKGSPYADKLKAALSQPMQKRNALIFTLMQQPGFREDARDLGTSIENKVGVGE